MLLKNKGDAFVYDGTKFVIGERVIATSGSAYEGMIGRILQICEGNDKDTDNDTPDIYCSFDEPILKTHKKKAIKRLSQLWNDAVKLEDANVAQALMSPDMIVPLDNFCESGGSTVVYTLIEESCANCNTDVSVRLFADKETALQQLEINLKKEFEGGMLDTDLSDGYVFEESEDSYECYLAGFAAEWRYYIHIEEQKLKINNDFIKAIGELDILRRLYDEFAEQSADLEGIDELTDKEFMGILENPNNLLRVRTELAKNEKLIRRYHESVYEIAHDIFGEAVKKKQEENK